MSHVIDPLPEPGGNRSARWHGSDHHPPCPGGCGELADECMTPGCGSPLGSMRIETDDDETLARPTPQHEALEALLGLNDNQMALLIRRLTTRYPALILDAVSWVKRRGRADGFQEQPRWVRDESSEPNRRGNHQ